MAFLIASRVRRRSPNEQFPYGYHRATSIAFLCASMALLALGSFVLFDSVTKLLMFEHPPIGLVKPFGDRSIWLGWPMLAALAWSALPAVLLGRAKQPLARELHDKVLVADAEMNRADWLTAGAAMLGVIGIVAIADLMDKEPTVVDHSRLDPLPLWVRNELMLLDWVKDAEVRLREEGHVYLGEAFVVPVDDQDLVERLQRANQHLLDLDWRLHELVITPVSEIQRPRAGRRRALSHGLATDPSLSSPSASGRIRHSVPPRRVLALVLEAQIAGVGACFAEVHHGVDQGHMGEGPEGSCPAAAWRPGRTPALAAPTSFLRSSSRWPSSSSPEVRTAGQLPAVDVRPATA